MLPVTYVPAGIFRLAHYYSRQSLPQIMCRSISFSSLFVQFIFGLPYSLQNFLLYCGPTAGGAGGAFIPYYRSTKHDPFE